MNRAARLIESLPRREGITLALIDLQWLPVKARNVYKICLMTSQALQFEKLKYINDLLKSFHLDTSMTLRHNVDRHRLNEPRCNLDISFRAFAACAPRLCNKLPENIKNNENLQIFKKKLKTHLFTECYRT